MTAPRQGPPVSTLDDVVQAIHDLFAAVGALRVTPGDGLIEWLVGERYRLQQGVPPRIIVITGAEGRMGAPPKLSAGYVASIREDVSFFIWGAETTADGDRYRAAKAIAMRVVNCLRRVAPGRLEGLRLVRSDTPDIVSFGEQYQLSSSYTWGVPTDGPIWAVPTTPVSPPDPDRPQGDTGFDIDVTTAAAPSR